MTAAQYGDDTKFPMWALHACLAYWFGEKGVAQLNFTKIGRIASDGGSYDIKGTKISAPGEGQGIIYHSTRDFMDRPEDAWIIEFWDGSGGRLLLNESDQSVTFDNYYHKDTFYTPMVVSCVDEGYHTGSDCDCYI